LSALLPALAGANMIYGMGMLDMGMILSFEQMVIDDDIVAMVKRSVQGIDVNRELLAVDLIKEVGIGGHFLTSTHTREHFKNEQIHANIFERRIRDAWEAAGSRDLKDVANEKAKEILKSHKPTPILDDVAMELKRIVKSAG
jgi:trimethylamine--corrinoid protein Co-methyltransferase